MFRLIPRETKFFELLAELSNCMNQGARLLRLHPADVDPGDPDAVGEA